MDIDFFMKGFCFNLLQQIVRWKHPSRCTSVKRLFIFPQVVSHCSEALPPSIVAPLLSPECIRLLSEEASTEEDQLWQTLGDAWNIPRYEKTFDNLRSFHKIEELLHSC